MKFGDIKVSDAAGSILAHTTRTDFATLKKGTRLTAEDCRGLANAGLEIITAARLEDGDVHEDDAAARLAEALCGHGLKTSAAFTGRCNITAREPGLVQLNAALVNKINAIDEAVTVATLNDLDKADAGQIVATVKIIPFAVPKTVMDGVSDVLVGQSASVSLLSFKPRSAVVINTVLPSLKESIIAKTTDLTKRRLESVGTQVTDVLTCAHEISDVAEAVHQAAASNPDLVVIVGASVTVDRDDVVPCGITQAGGDIIHFGMPVDPGNLMLLANHPSCPVLVLPGCARSPKLNGIDWVLQRLAAGLDVGCADIMAMGVGGLLVDSPVRPLPRDEAVRSNTESPDAVNIAVLVLAAGQSRRMGATNKLLERIDGAPLIRRTVESALASEANTVVVVTGHQAEDVGNQLGGLDIKLVHNADYADGLSGSLKVGLAALPRAMDGAIVVLGDMPDIAPNHLNALIDGFDPAAGRAIGVPVHNGKRGNPVLWASRFFNTMTDVRGDVGARHLIGEHDNLVYEVEFGDTAVLTDLDTPEAWAQYRAGKSS